MTRGYKPVDLYPFINQRLHDRRHYFVRTQHKKIGEVLFFCLDNGCCRGRSGSLKTDSQEDNLFFGVVSGHFKRFQHRIDDPDIMSVCFLFFEGTCRTRHTNQITIGCNDDFREFTICDGSIDEVLAGYANRTTGAGEQPDIGR